MNKRAVLIYGVVCYLIFFATFLYAIGFVGNVVVPKSIDSGTEETGANAWLINVVLLGLFAAPHSVMARPAFKRWWTRFVPTYLERSTYVLIASLFLALLFWQWQPIRDVVWDIDIPAVQFALQAVFWIGWALVLLSTFLINHFDLFGLRQVWMYAQGRPYEPVVFRETLFYRYIRHPLMLGFIIAFWATPRMTLGHLLFALATTAYILIAIQLEERDLLRAHGETYAAYQRRTGMLLPRAKPAPSGDAPAA